MGNKIEQYNLKQRHTCFYSKQNLSLCAKIPKIINKNLMKPNQTAIFENYKSKKKKKRYKTGQISESFHELKVLIVIYKF